MDASLNSAHRSKVQEFLRKHRIGLLTLLFTDIVGSTLLKQTLGDAEAVMHIKQHHHLLRDLLKVFAEAEEISTAGDSFFIVFSRPSDALRFALILQSRLRSLSQGTGVPVLDRIGIHVGEVMIDENHFGEGGKDLYGIQVDNCARVMSLAEGDQILMSRVVFDNARQVLRRQEVQGLEELSWLNHGAYAMKGLEDPVEVCEVGERGKAVLAPPGDSEKARRHSTASGEIVPGWRPALGQTVPKTRWVLEEKLGEGAFGEVWLARHQTLKDQRVLKFCFRADRVRSLKREATIFKILRERAGNHPGIVTVHDLYLDEPPYYLVMDYVPGRDLKAWCARQGGLKAVPIGLRLSLVADVAEALQAAHEAGIIHRDIKPTNILVVDDRTPAVSTSNRSGYDTLTTELKTRRHGPSAKLTDFGIGQVTTDEALAGLTQLGFTQTLMSSSSSGMAGTQTYMAPEVLAGKPATTRSDIYSLGVLLYQMIVGDWDRHLTMDWPRDIEDALLREDLARCFAGNVRERFAGPGELARRLRSLDQRRADQAKAATAQAVLERAAYRRGMVRTACVALLIIALFGALAAIAFIKSQNEVRLRNEAGRNLISSQQNLKLAQKSAYFGNMLRAQRAWEVNDIGQVLKFLEECASYSGHGFEWYYWQRQTHLSLMTLRGHLEGVSTAAFSPDGQRIVTGSSDQTAKVWEAATGMELITLKGHSGGVSSVSFSPDGRRIVSGSGDATAKVWEAATGREILTLKGHSKSINSVDFSPDGQRIVTGGYDGTARIWDAAAGLEGLTLKGHSNRIFCVAFSPDSQRIATASLDDEVKVWQAATGRELLTLKGHGAGVLSVAFSGDGHRIATGSYDNTAKIWEATTGRELITLKGHSEYVGSVAFSRDGLRLVTSSGDSTAKVWKTAASPEMLTLKGHKETVFSVAFSSDGQRLVTGSGDGTAKVWEVATGREILTLSGHSEPILCVAFSSDGKRIVTSSSDKTAKVWDAASPTFATGTEKPVFFRGPR